MTMSDNVSYGKANKLLPMRTAFILERQTPERLKTFLDFYQMDL